VLFAHKQYLSGRIAETRYEKIRRIIC